jgi:hypothetical protein
MTTERDEKRALRAIRNVPIDAPASWIAEDEERRTGMWCLIGGNLEWVPRDGSQTETTWDDPVELAVLARFIGTLKERVHESHSSAVRFVQSRCG